MNEKGLIINLLKRMADEVSKDETDWNKVLNFHDELSMRIPSIVVMVEPRQDEETPMRNNQQPVRRRLYQE